MRIELYGVLKQVVGSAELDQPDPVSGATVDDVLAEISVATPVLAPHLANVACAQGQQLLRRDQPVDPAQALVLLPPVSGGSSTTAPHLVEWPLDLQTLLDETANPRCGALVAFAGTVRNHHEGQPVDSMAYTAYGPMAEQVLAELERETIARFGVEACRIMHRTGHLGIGEDSVLVVVRSAHRAEAFDAGRFAIDTLKLRLPVWKEDIFPDGQRAFQPGVPLQATDAVVTPDALPTVAPDADGGDGFVPLPIAVLTVSDTRGPDDDKSGDLLAAAVRAAGHRLVDRAIVRDDIYQVRARVSGWIADPQVRVVITTGGTGITGRDTTPEAVRPLLDAELEGFGEVFRRLSYDEIGTSTIQSRAVGGIANATLVFSLPGSSGACRTAWNGVLAPQLDARTRPCNFVSLIPRMREASMSASQPAPSRGADTDRSRS